jgi:hypothetical protein
MQLVETVLCLEVQVVKNQICMCNEQTGPERHFHVPK